MRLTPEPGKDPAAQPRPFKSIYFYVLGSAAVPIIFLVGLLLLLEGNFVARLAKGPTTRLLCEQIQDMRKGVIGQLESRTFNPDDIDRRLKTGLSRLSSDLRWGINVGEFRYSSFGPITGPIADRLRQAPDVAEGTQYIDKVVAQGGRTYAACTQVYDLTGSRFGKYRKGVYVIAWPDADVTAMERTINEAMSSSSVLKMTLIPLGLMITIAVVGVQIVVAYALISSLKRDILSVLHGYADRLTPRRYPIELQPVVQLFNEVIEVNEAALKYTRTLVTKIAHDLNNKLQSLVSAVNAPTINRDLVRRHISGVKSQIDRYRQLANSSQADSQARWKADRFDLVTFVEETLWVQRIDLMNSRNHYRLCVDGVEQRSAADEDEDGSRRTVPVVCYQGDLEIMLSNLLSNASKYGGGQVEVNITPAGRDVLIDVDDNGPGIAEADRLRVFDEGEMLNPDQKLPGTGFGLDIVAMIAGLSRGTVAVSDSHLGGARFRLTLPILKPDKRDK